MRVRLIVDSTADLIPEVKAGVSVVPLTVHFGDEEYVDGVTITHQQFYSAVPDLFCFTVHSGYDRRS